MDKAELERRIEKKNKDIEKIEKRIAKWSKGLRPEDIAVCEPFGNCVYGTVPRGARWADYHGTEEYQKAAKAYKEYKQEHQNDIPTSDDWNKGPNISELCSAYRDLGEARATLNNYKLQIEKMDNFDKAEKIPAIWDFLTAWEQKVYAWYLKNAELYFELKQNYKQAKYEHTQQWLNNNPEPDRQSDYQAYRKWDNAKYYMEKHFETSYYSDIDVVTVNLTTFQKDYSRYDSEKIVLYTGYSIDTNKLIEVIKKEKQAKYEDLVNRVTSITGPITDASGLSIGNQKGELNGVVVGENGKARVETISAGGWNIQKFHYRVLVHEVK